MPIRRLAQSADNPLGLGESVTPAGSLVPAGTRMGTLPVATREGERACPPPCGRVTGLPPHPLPGLPFGGGEGGGWRDRPSPLQTCQEEGLRPYPCSTDTSGTPQVRARVWEFPDGREMIATPLTAPSSPRSDSAGVALTPEQRSEKDARNRERADRRARQTIRRYTRHNQLDHMLTLTFPSMVTDYHHAYELLRGFYRSAPGKRLLPEVKVSTPERHKNGSWHFHVLVRGRQPVVTIRHFWTAYLLEHGCELPDGASVARVHVKEIGVRACYRYASKYVTKDTSGLPQHANRYYRSLGYNPPVSLVSGPLEAVVSGPEWEGATVFTNDGDEFRWLWQGIEEQ